MLYVCIQVAIACFVLACNCFQHSNECIYDPEVDRQGLSLDIYGKREGGGVCQNCQHNTEGVNCNKCKPTFYKPYNKHWNETDVCHRKFHFICMISTKKTNNLGTLMYLENKLLH